MPATLGRPTTACRGHPQGQAGEAAALDEVEEPDVLDEDDEEESDEDELLDALDEESEDDDVAAAGVVDELDERLSVL